MLMHCKYFTISKVLIICFSHIVLRGDNLTRKLNKLTTKLIWLLNWNTHLGCINIYYQTVFRRRIVNRLWTQWTIFSSIINTIPFLYRYWRLKMCKIRKSTEHMNITGPSLIFYYEKLQENILKNVGCICKIRY